MTDEIKFPLEFKACPNCGSERRLAGELIEQEKEKGKAGPDTVGALNVFSAIIADPRRAILQAPGVTAYTDMCLDCGTIYCVRVDGGKVTPQMKPVKFNPQFPPNFTPS